tara:strand:+ start:1175 stop:1387 length:213 start_codon:yes stop_codon:yes gene_type:complete
MTVDTENPVIKVTGDGSGDKSEDDYGSNLANFEALLTRLEGSKKRQQRQRSVEGRRDTWAQGLAGMMSNF